MIKLKLKNSDKDIMLWLLWKGMEITKSNNKYNIFDRLYNELLTKCQISEKIDKQDEGKVLNIANVSKQRERLIAFRGWWYGNRRTRDNITIIEIDEYLDN